MNAHEVVEVLLLPYLPVLVSRVRTHVVSLQYQALVRVRTQVLPADREDLRLGLLKGRRR